MVNINVPIIILTVIGQTAFAIPEHSDGKIVVPLTVLLGFMFVHGIVATELPRSETSPSIAIYVLSCILLSGTSVLFSAFCMWMVHMTHPMPRSGTSFSCVCSAPSSFLHSGSNLLFACGAVGDVSLFHLLRLNLSRQSASRPSSTLRPISHSNQ